MLLDCPDLSHSDLSSWKGLLYGASPMAETLLHAALKQLPSVGFTQGYGQTELAPLATLLGPEWHVFEGHMAGKLRSAGRPGICVELRIVDADGVEEIGRAHV